MHLHAEFGIKWTLHSGNLSLYFYKADLAHGYTEQGDASQYTGIITKHLLLFVFKYGLCQTWVLDFPSYKDSQLRGFD